MPVAAAATRRDAAPPRRAPAELRARFRDGKAALLARFARRGRPRRPRYALLRALAAPRRRHAAAPSGSDAGMPAGAALVAVGGYGRGELFPHSDVDVLVLLPPADGAPTATPLTPRSRRFITACWDTGLEIGSSVRTVDECVAMARARRHGADRAARIALPVRRAQRLQRASARANAQAMDPKAFLRAKTLEMRQRHQKYENTPYSLEPNCKESPGGLRDLQVVIWVARAAGLGRSWSELAAQRPDHAVRGASSCSATKALLKLIRARLHVIAGRREDRLVFDLQTAVAESFGYQRDARRSAPREALMRRYYWAAKAVTQLNQILMLNIEERINGPQDAPMRPINEQASSSAAACSRSRATTSTSATRTRSSRPSCVYQQTVGAEGPVGAHAARALQRARPDGREVPPRPGQPRDLHAASCRQPSGQTHAFRLMNQTSVLGRYLWVFRRIVGQMQHDLFHVYTVDQHILMVLRNVRRFFIPEHAHEYPFCSQLAVDLRPALGALRRRAVPRHRQGPRRRPLRARRARGAPLLPRPRHRRARTPQLIEFLVARAPDDVAHRAEGRPVRPRRDRRLRRARSAASAA